MFYFAIISECAQSNARKRSVVLRIILNVFLGHFDYNKTYIIKTSNDVRVFLYSQISFRSINFI